MAAQPPPYPTDPSAAYPPPTAESDVKPGVPSDAYQPGAGGGYVPPPTTAAGPEYQPPGAGYSVPQQPQTTVSCHNLSI